MQPTKANQTHQKSSIGTIVTSSIVLRDCLFLALVVFGSLVLYVNHLGLYSDDWHFLGLMTNSNDQSLFGLVRSVLPYTRLRPIESIYVAGLYWLFGPAPLQYHLVNAAVFILTIVLFYLSLRELTEHRMFAVAIRLVYALLPHFSSVRFWFIAFVINLSIGFYFLSLYSDLRAVRAGAWHFWKWKLSGSAAMLCSAFSYEVALPLFLLNPFLVWFRSRQLVGPHSDKKPARKAFVIALTSNVLAIMLVAFYKILTARGGSDLFVHRMGIQDEYSHHLFRLAVGAVGVNYGSNGIAMPVKVLRVLQHYPNPSILGLGLVIGLIVFVYLYHQSKRHGLDLSSEQSYFRLMGLGIVVFALGYAIFLTNSQVGFTPTGVKNRSAIAAAIGVAVSFVAVIGWLSWLLPLRLRRGAFALLVSLLATSGFLINNTVATFWVDASRRQQAVIAAVRQEFPTLPPESTLILNGVCPYTGPGIVFECYWDVGGMLKTYYRDTSLKGDIVRPNIKMDEKGLYTGIYGEKKFYAYGDKLLVFDLEQMKTFRLIDAETARRYLLIDNSDHQSRCPAGDEGYGVAIF